jgi:XapX domain-containing protein
MDDKKPPVKISVIASEGTLETKGLLISFVVGLLVGVAYGVIRVKNPAPPIVALIGLLGWCQASKPGYGFSQRRSKRQMRISSHRG